MLADYFRQVGADVTVVRHVHAQEMLKQKNWDLLVLSPGPGRPEDFGISKTIGAAHRAKTCRSSASARGCRRSANISAGSSASSASPRTAGRRAIQVRGGRLMQNLPNEIVIGRYHSLYVERDSMPDVLIGHRNHRGRRGDGDRTQDACRSAACSFTRNR